MARIDQDREAIEAKDEAYRFDLNPNDHAGEGRGDPQPDRTGFDIKELVRQYKDLPDDLLKQIPVLDTGTRLEEGATYFDLKHPDRGIFTGMNNMEAGPDNWYMPKNQVDYELWNRLTGETDAARLGRLTTDYDLNRPAS